MAPFNNDDIFTPLDTSIGSSTPDRNGIPELQRSYSTASSASSSGRSSDDTVNSASTQDPLGRRRRSRGESMRAGSKGAQNFFGKERALSMSLSSGSDSFSIEEPEPKTFFNDTLHHDGVFDDKFWVPPSFSATTAERSDDTPNKTPMVMATVPRLRRMRSESIQAGTKGGFFGGPPSQDDGAVSPS